MGQRQSALVESHVDGDLAAVVAILFVFAVTGLGILLAKAFEVGLGDVVEDDAAAAFEQVGLGVAQGCHDGLALGEESVASVAEAVFGGHGDADAEQFGQGGALGPVDQRPLAHRFDEAVGDEELSGGGLRGVQPVVAEDLIEIERTPGGAGDELR